MVVAKSEINVLVKNPEIVFVADLTRADAPALVMTTECELVMKSDPDGQLMTAVVKDLKVVACPFLKEKRNKETTVLQPCQVFFKSTQSSTSPQAMEVCINALTLKVGRGQKQNERLTNKIPVRSISFGHRPYCHLFPVF